MRGNKVLVFEVSRIIMRTIMILFPFCSTRQCSVTAWRHIIPVIQIFHWPALVFNVPGEICLALLFSTVLWKEGECTSFLGWLVVMPLSLTHASITIDQQVVIIGYRTSKNIFALLWKEWRSWSRWKDMHWIQIFVSLFTYKPFELSDSNQFSNFVI